MYVYPVANSDFAEPSCPEAPPTRRIWRLDLDIETDLDRVAIPKPTPEFDLTISSCIVRTTTKTDLFHSYASVPALIPNDQPCKKPKPIDYRL